MTLILVPTCSRLPDLRSRCDCSLLIYVADLTTLLLGTPTPLLLPPLPHVYAYLHPTPIRSRSLRYVRYGCDSAPLPLFVTHTTLGLPHTTVAFAYYFTRFTIPLPSTVLPTVVPLPLFVILYHTVVGLTTLTFVVAIPPLVLHTGTLHVDSTQFAVTLPVTFTFTFVTRFVRFRVPHTGCYVLFPVLLLFTHTCLRLRYHALRCLPHYTLPRTRYHLFTCLPVPHCTPYTAYTLPALLLLNYRSRYGTLRLRLLRFTDSGRYVTLVEVTTFRLRFTFTVLCLVITFVDSHIVLPVTVLLYLYLPTYVDGVAYVTRFHAGYVVVVPGDYDVTIRFTVAVIPSTVTTPQLMICHRFTGPFGDTIPGRIRYLLI